MYVLGILSIFVLIAMIVGPIIWGVRVRTEPATDIYPADVMGNAEDSFLWKTLAKSIKRDFKDRHNSIHSRRAIIHSINVMRSMRKIRQILN